MAHGVLEELVESWTAHVLRGNTAFDQLFLDVGHLDDARNLIGQSPCDGLRQTGRRYEASPLCQRDLRKTSIGARPSTAIGT